jgi:hypothetical protein
MAAWREERAFELLRAAAFARELARNRFPAIPCLQGI